MQLSADDPRVQAYAQHTLAPRLTDVYSISKMLYWRDHPQEAFLKPIYIGIDHTGINGVHPGQTRFLSAHLLNKPIEVIVNERIQKQTSILGWSERIRTLYNTPAHTLAQKITAHTAYELYSELYSKGPAYRAY